MADTPSTGTSLREAEILDRHLPEGYSAEPDVLGEISENGQTSELGLAQQALENSLRLQGGDIHRDIYKIKARANAPRRSATFSAPRSPLLQPVDGPSVDAQLEPGGFRRQYMQRQALKRNLTNVYVPVTRDFISFLELYGGFAGEDLRDTDDEDESAIDEDEQQSERRPLLGRRKSTKKWKREGDASTVRTFFTLIKAFVGCGIMFLPKAFRNGGILFSSLTLVTVSTLTTVCFRLLLHCRKKYGGSYGELGEAIVGPRFRSVILSSIGLSQLGFVCTGLIFTAENLYAFLDAVTKGRDLPIGVGTLIALQLILLIPLSLIRNVSKIGPAALLADIFILIGLVYIWQYDIASLATKGINPSVKLFNPAHFTLTIGSAIFTFEGIGLILPIQSSMKKPEHFSRLLYMVMLIITVVFTSVGVLCYATFGEATKIQIISNFPQSSKLVNAVQFLYSLAILVGQPIQLFPAVRILEQAIFGDKASGKKSDAVKWKKNGLRTTMVLLCGAISIVGASDLDKFVALIGSFACVPLVYIYPAYLHYKGCATTRAEQVADLAMMVLGLVAMVYTTAVTVAQWISS